MGKAFQPGVHYFVGGATKIYGAALYRLRREDFGELRHYDGISPAWPIGYDEMEPYYTKAEADVPGPRCARRRPDRAAGQRALSFPAVSHEPRIQQLHDDLARAGYHPFHSPCGIMLNEKRSPFSPCIRCKDCDGFPCLVHAKSDAEVLGVRPALQYPNVTLLTQALRAHAEDQRGGHRGDRGGRRARRARRETYQRRHRRRLVRRRQLGQAAAAVGQRHGIPTGWPTAQTRSGATTCSTTAWRCWPSPRSRIRPSSRRPWA